MAGLPQRRSWCLLARRLGMAWLSVATAGALALSLVSIGSLGGHGALAPGSVSAAQGQPRLDKPAAPVRIWIPAVGIDLPVVSSARKVKGNTNGYPLCDVAQYWTRYDLPGAPGTTWIYAHAQPGMFLPLFTTSEATDGAGLLGKIVNVQLMDGRVLRYRINEVKERSRSRRIALRDRPSQHKLILQTSVGPPGTIPKLQAAARLVGATRTDDPAPKARPRACWQPRPANDSKNGGTNGKMPKRTPVPTAAPAADGGSLDATTLVLGSGAVLLGATLVAVYLVRRQP